MGEDFLHGVEVVPPQVPVDWAGLHSGVVDDLSVLRFVPLGVDPLPVLPYSPGLLDKVPDGVGEVVVDVTDDVDEDDQQPEQRVEQPGVGHVARGNRTHTD